jgi:hypothetical protein
MGAIVLFETFRWLLALAVTIYTLVISGQWLWNWLKFFQTSRQTALLGRYAGVLLVRIRLRRFGWELFQIALLLIVFGYILYWHHSLREGA